MRRPRRGAAVAIAATIAATVGALPAGADHRVGHNPPQGPAKVRFASDFPELTDHEWGFQIGGFGGIERRAPRRHVPVILVHGNTTDHADWYPVRDQFHEAGWTDQELWALSINGLGSNNGGGSNPERDAEHREMGWDGQARITGNDVNVPDLYDFIRAVQAYTGSKKFSIVSHSLGVTVARKTLKVHPKLRRDLVAFVGIAGGNHGTSLCPPGSEGVLMSCDEIAADTPWLGELNGPEGRDETYGPARWMTIYDGTGAGDVGYVGPAYAQSPRLEGAENVEFPNMDHNVLRTSPETVAVYRAFLEAAEQPYLRGGDTGSATGTGSTAGGSSGGTSTGTTASASTATSGSTSGGTTTSGATGADTTTGTTAAVPTGEGAHPATGGGLAVAALACAPLVLRRRRHA